MSGKKDLASFKRYWNSMVKGINNAWTLPVMVSKDQESRAAFEKFGVDVDEMMFSKWMTFLSSIICAIYGISPDEINFESFSAGRSSLSGSDTAEKLANSKDNGMRPLLAYLENIFSDFVIQDFSEQYVFRWTGIDEEDEDKRHELRKMVLTVNEMRAQEGYDKLTEDWGDAPLNPSLIGVWQAGQQQGQQDFGDPDERQGDDDQKDDDEDTENVEGNNTDDEKKDAMPVNVNSDGDKNSDNKAIKSGEQKEDMSKAFGLPVYTFDV